MTKKATKSACDIKGTKTLKTIGKWAFEAIKSTFNKDSKEKNGEESDDETEK